MDIIIPNEYLSSSSRGGEYWEQSHRFRCNSNVKDGRGINRTKHAPIHYSTDSYEYTDEPSYPYYREESSDTKDSDIKLHREQSDKDLEPGL